MSRTYKATGINLKAIPLGETDRLLTILTPDVGLVRAVAPGSRKHQSRLGGRSDLFVVNDWLIVKGKRLDKLIQAETIRTFPGLSQNLGRLTASQYLAEIVLFTALSDCPQKDLFHLLIEHLERLESSPSGALLAALSHGIYHLLALAGVAPEVHRCCLTQVEIVPNLLDPAWSVEFDTEAGGLVRPQGDEKDRPNPTLSSSGRPLPQVRTRQGRYTGQKPGSLWLTATDVALLQQLSKPELITTVPLTFPSLTSETFKTQELWSRIERLLREYAQGYFERPIRSAALVDVCFATV
ncbi:MAG: DNA repair protein RecO [Leptolyngbyaceae cyanobacterium SM2_3_12]|nr:DNA repair protein RecO [Leptolyngbyaceae cyanobacterium SM2_3_12]